MAASCAGQTKSLSCLKDRGQIECTESWPVAGRQRRAQRDRGADETETALRNRAWIEGNLHKVDKLSAGRLAYVYLPDTGFGGYTSFNRYFFAQVGREGAVIDERFNGGGSAADYVIDYLRRPLELLDDARRPGFHYASGAIFGPKAMITNMYAGSGGDALPWYFRKASWAHLSAPGHGAAWWEFMIILRLWTAAQSRRRAWLFKSHGRWDIENHGVAPDYEVEITPKDWASGHDPQLEKAVSLVMDSSKKNPLPVAKRPAFPQLP